jgi:hypothetical protein
VRTLWVTLAALLGGAAGFVVAFLVGIDATSSWQCDGPCFDRWDDVELVAGAVGAACALGFGLLARTIHVRIAARTAKPSD